MADKKLGLIITGDSTGGRKAVKDFGADVEKTESITAKAGAKVKQHLASLDLKDLAVGALNAADESAKVAAQSNAVLKSTGNAANTTADAMADLAGEISKKTGIDDEAIQSGENWLATFKNVRNEAGKGNDVFDQTTTTMVDLSVAMGSDAKSAANLLGKALNDPLKGISALGRAGVTFSVQQKEQIANFVKTGDLLSAQKIILGEVNSQVAGSAEAQATESAKAKVAIDNLEEALGGALAPTLHTVATLAAGGAEALSSLPEPLQQGIVLAGGAAIAWAKWGDELKSTGRAISSAVGGLDGLKNAGPLAATGIGVLAGSFLLLKANQAEQAAQEKAWQGELTAMAKKAKDTGDTIDEVFRKDQLLDWATESAGFLDEYGVDLGDLNKALDGSKKEWERYRDGVLGANPAEIAKGKTSELRVGLDSLRTALVETRERSKDYNAATKELAESNEKAGTKVDKMVASQADAVIVFGKAAIATHDQAVELGEIKTQSDAARDAISDYFDEISGHLDKSVAVEQAYDDLTKSLVENGKTFDKGRQEGRNNIRALEDYRDAAAAVAQAERERTGTSQAGIDSLEASADRFADLARKAGYSDEKIAAMQYTMGLTKPQIETTFKSNATQTEIAFGRLVDKQKEIQDRANLAVMVSVSGLDRLALAAQLVAAIGGRSAAQAAVDTIVGTASAGAGGVVAGRASGGPVPAGWEGLVGEDGPEWLKIGAQGGYVTDADKTAAMFSGGSAAPVPSPTTRAVLGGAGGGSGSGDIYVTAIFEGPVLDLAGLAKRVAPDIRNELLKQAKLRPAQNTSMQNGFVSL